ncbi:hypothetical protein ACNI3K_00510 [Demequina sp. SO4-13]|uniref:hypothetical protein n=1 Tax=Demequina sp. SO4-13 TaxID=3401027 RepID=UPI003AF89B49
MHHPPSKSIRLLESVPNKVYRRLVVRYPYQTDRDYALSYRFAAQRLAKSFAGNNEDDLILLPFLALYRQAFELELKNLIRLLVHIRVAYVEGDTFELRQAISKKRFKDELGHNLHKLLNAASTHYSALALPEPFPREVARFIVMLHEADTTGTAFRYAGQLPDTQEYADFPDLAALLDQQYDDLAVIADYADGVYSAGPTLKEHDGEGY